VRDKTRWTIVWLLVAAGVLAAWQIGKAPAAIPVLRAELGLSLTQASWVISIFNAIGIVTGMAFGALGDRLGHRRVVLAGLVVMAVASLIGATAAGPALLLATRFFEGLGFMAVVVPIPAILVRACSAADLRLAFGVWGGYMPAGVSLMVLVAPWIMARVGWRGLWLGDGLLLLAFAVLLWASLRRLARGPRQASAVSALEGIRRTVVSPGPLLLAAIFGAYAGVHISVIGFLPTLLIEEQGLTLAAAGAVTALAMSMNILGNLLGGALLQRGWARWRLVGGTFVAMGLCALGIYDGGLPDGVRFALVLLLNFVGGIIPASCFAGTPVHAPSPALVGTTNGFMNQGAQLGQTLTPPLVAAVVVWQAGWRAAPWVLVPLLGLGVLLSLALRAREPA